MNDYVLLTLEALNQPSLNIWTKVLREKTLKSSRSCRVQFDAVNSGKIVTKFLHKVHDDSKLAVPVY